MMPLVLFSVSCLLPRVRASLRSYHFPCITDVVSLKIAMAD